MARERRRSVERYIAKKLANEFSDKYWRDKKPRIKVIDIGPDPPRYCRKYIWGRK